MSKHRREDCKAGEPYYGPDLVGCSDCFSGEEPDTEMIARILLVAADKDWPETLWSTFYTFVKVEWFVWLTENGLLLEGPNVRRTKGCFGGLFVSSTMFPCHTITPLGLRWLEDHKEEVRRQLRPRIQDTEKELAKMKAVCA